MDTIFDSPVWAWKLQHEQQYVADHDTLCNIVKPGDDDPNIVATVQLTPPTDVFPFIRQQGYAPGSESYFTIRIDGKRAYLTLNVQGTEGFEDYRMFYWTRSNAPGWLKRHLP